MWRGFVAQMPHAFPRTEVRGYRVRKSLPSQDAAWPVWRPQRRTFLRFVAPDFSPGRTGRVTQPCRPKQEIIGHRGAAQRQADRASRKEVASPPIRRH